MTDNRRVLVRHRTGPRTGLIEIAGLVSRFNGQIPALLPRVELGHTIADLHLERVEPSYVLYREVDPTVVAGFAAPAPVPGVWEDQEADAMGDVPQNRVDLPPVCA